ncbi:MAG: general secretion pathway protein GspB [Desulfobacterales bacterium]|nr:general secretion pathway protein GspB [Desulfobacterales bacterium]
MSKREKIIIAVTLLVAVAGLLDILVFSRAEKNAKISGQQAGLTGEEFAMQAMTRLSGIESSDKKTERRAWINAIESEWLRDPFPNVEKTKITSPQQNDIGNVVFSGYIQHKNKMFAIINGMEYAKGETIPTASLQNLKLVNILPDRVILSNGPRQIILPMKEKDK